MVFRRGPDRKINLLSIGAAYRTHKHITLSTAGGDTGTTFDDAVNNFIKKVYDGGVKDGQIDRGLYEETAKHLTDALVEGMGAHFTYDDPKNKLATNLRANIWQFSAAKSQVEYRAFRDAMLDENGKLKPFTQYRKDIEATNKMFNEDWLQSEYNTAVAGAQNGARWKDFERDADVYPILEKVVIEDERTCPICGGLHGLRAPIWDKVWDTVAGSLHFQCRCYEIQVTDGRPQPTQRDELYEKVGATKKQMQPGFINNVGKTETSFTADDGIIDAAGAMDINRWKAVDTYGLQEPPQIAKQDLPERQTIATNKQELQEAWEQHVKDAGVNDDEFLAINKATGDQVLFDKNLFNHLSKRLRNAGHDVAPQLLEVVQDADEVFVNNLSGKHYSTRENSFVFIKYYKDQPVIVLAQMDEDRNCLVAYSAYGLDDYNNKSSMGKMRRGILLHAKK